MFTRRQLLTLVSILMAAVAGPAWALEAPEGPVVLTISGQIGVKNAGDTAVFDAAMLEALPQHSFTTRTPWYDKPVRFTGPLMADLLKAVQARGTVLEAVAINDYKVSIPMEDSRKFPLIVARLMNGEPMTVRDKGPLFVVYPFDSSRELRKLTFFERSIWQLKALEVKP
jgi:hypothetical protein